MAQLRLYSQQFLLSTGLYLEGSLGLLVFRFKSAPLQTLLPEEPPSCFGFCFQVGARVLCEHLWMIWKFPCLEDHQRPNGLLFVNAAAMWACSCQKFVSIL